MDQILNAGFKLSDGGGGFVPGHSELLVQAARTGGHVRHKVFGHQHLVVPRQVHRVSGDVTDSEVLWRRYWKKKAKILYMCPQSLNVQRACKRQTHIWLR